MFENNSLSKTIGLGGSLALTLIATGALGYSSYRLFTAPRKMTGSAVAISIIAAILLALSVYLGYKLFQGIKEYRANRLA